MTTFNVGDKVIIPSFEAEVTSYYPEAIGGPTLYVRPTSGWQGEIRFGLDFLDKIERVLPPIPTALGTVIRHVETGTVLAKADTYWAILFRPLSAQNEMNWAWARNGVADPSDWEVLYDPEA